MIKKIDYEKYMRKALALAKEASNSSDVQVGALVLYEDKIIGVGFNEREKHQAITKHAEIVAIEEAEKFLHNWRLDNCSLVVTLEPCLMCMGAIISSRISSLVYGASDQEAGAISRFHVLDYLEGKKQPLIFPGVLEKECQELLKNSWKQTTKKEL